MAKIYYHTQAGATGKFVIWSHASSLTEAGKTLAKQNRIWPDSSSDGQVITIGKKQRGRTGIRPIKEYRLFGDKLVKIADSIYNRRMAQIMRTSFFDHPSPWECGKAETHHHRFMRDEEKPPYTGNLIVLKEQRRRQDLWDGETYIQRYRLFLFTELHQCLRQ